MDGFLREKLKQTNKQTNKTKTKRDINLTCIINGLDSIQNEH